MKQYKLACKSTGVDCDTVVTGSNIEEVMVQESEHAAAEHNLPVMPPNIYEKCVAAIEEFEA